MPHADFAPHRPRVQVFPLSMPVWGEDLYAPFLILLRVFLTTSFHHDRLKAEPQEALTTNSVGKTIL